MTARYDGKCRSCGGAIHAGVSRIRWERGYGATHADTEVCDSYFEQAAEMAAERAFEARLTGSWVYDYDGAY